MKHVSTRWAAKRQMPTHVTRWRCKLQPFIYVTHGTYAGRGTAVTPITQESRYEW